MRAHILAEDFGGSKLCTTGDLARMVERTPRGARWIADQEHLACERTAGGYRLFRESDVLRLVERRVKARLRRVSAFRPKKVGASGGPHQMSLFDRRLPAKSDGDGQNVSLPKAEVHGARSPRKRSGSDKRDYRNLRGQPR